MTINPRGLHIVTDRDGAAILDVERSCIFTVNPTGAYVWERLQRGEELDNIIASLARETGADADLVDRDVRNFVESLRSNQLLVTEDNVRG